MDVRGELRGLLVGVLCLGVVAGAVAGAPASEVMLSPKDGPVQPGETVAYDVVVENASGGVGSFDVTVRTNDSAVVAIRNVTYDDSADYTRDAEGPTEARLAATGMNTLDTGPVTVATVTVEAADLGTAELSVSVTALGDESGDPYTVTDEQNRTLSVEPEPTPTPEPAPTDPTPEPTPDADDGSDDAAAGDTGGGGGAATDTEAPEPTAGSTPAPTGTVDAESTPEPTSAPTETVADVDPTPEPTPGVEAGGVETRTLAAAGLALLAAVVAVVVLRRRGRL
jgi:hypothetical protein